MKNTLSLVSGFLALVLVGSLVGCGDGGPIIPTYTNPTQTQTQTQTQNPTQTTNPYPTIPENPSVGGVTPGKFLITGMMIGASADLDFKVYNADTTPTKYLAFFIVPYSTDDSQYTGFSMPPGSAVDWLTFGNAIIQVGAKSWYTVPTNLSIPSSYKGTIPSKWMFMMGVTEVFATPLLKSVSSTTSTFEVGSTAEFPPVGTFTIGRDLYVYASKDSTHFYGVQCSSTLPSVHVAGEQIWRQNSVSVVNSIKVFVQMKT